MNLIEVYDPSFTSVMRIPPSCISNLPQHPHGNGNGNGNARFVICRHFDPAKPQTSCPKGEFCRFVHANLKGNIASQHSIHVNYAWRSLDLVKYPRMKAGGIWDVRTPHGKQTDMIPSEAILETRGATAVAQGRFEKTHCVHYYLNRMCHLGSDCMFIHAAYVNPSAKDLQRAPPAPHFPRARNEPPSVTDSPFLQHHELLDLSLSPPTTCLGAPEGTGRHSPILSFGSIEQFLTACDSHAQTPVSLPPRAVGVSSTSSSSQASSTNTRYRWNPYSQKVSMVML